MEADSINPQKPSHQLKTVLDDYISARRGAPWQDKEVALFPMPPELLWWAQEQDEMKSPNLVAFTEHFNN
ncbi:hypothetical protein TELCIR_19967, partial [Teladorsagia circumcincta]